MSKPMLIKRFASLAIFIAVLALSYVCSAGAPDHVSAALAIFDSYCLTASPDFAAIDRRATAAGYQMFMERSTPLPPGKSIHQKNWVVPLPSGKISLSVTDGGNGPLHVVTCTIGILEVDAADVEAALSADPRLGTPVKRAQQDSGAGSFVTWHARLGTGAPIEDSLVLMADGVPGQQQPSVAVNYVFRSHADR